MASGERLPYKYNARYLRDTSLCGGIPSNIPAGVISIHGQSIEGFQLVLNRPRRRHFAEAGAALLGPDVVAQSTERWQRQSAVHVPKHETIHTFLSHCSARSSNPMGVSKTYCSYVMRLRVGHSCVWVSFTTGKHSET